MSAVTATVVVCAYTLDRWDALVASLLSAANQDPVPDELMLVVDHNDALRARAEAEIVPLVPSLIVLSNERTKGLSGARNTALDHATSDVVVFLDDDASAEDGWLALLLAPYAEPHVIGVGGSATPVWPDGHARPVTLPQGAGDRGVLDWVVGCTYEGQPTVTAPVRNLMGCNMSLLRAEAIAAGGFSEDLGRVGKTPLGCEETELCIRLSQRDRSARIVFVPQAGVRHRVSTDRLTWGYLVRRGYAEGLSKAMVTDKVGGDSGLETERGYVLRVLPRAVARELVGAPGVAGGPRRRPRPAGAAAVVAVLAATVGGYLRGTTARLLTRRA